MVIETHKKIALFIVCSLFCVAAVRCPAWAGSPQDREAWHFQLSPYAWLAGQKGTVTPLSSMPAVDIDIDFWDDIADNINGALMLIGEARKGRFGVMMDLVYTDIEDDAVTPGPLFSSAASRTESLFFTALLFYRAVDRSDSFLDVGVGARSWSVDSTLKVRSGMLPGRKFSNSESWVDPIVGAKGRMMLGESHFFVNGGLALGGFGAASDFMWDLNVNIGYQWTEALAVLLGYRYLDVDYEDGTYRYDVSQHGPMLGMTWRF